MRLRSGKITNLHNKLNRHTVIDLTFDIVLLCQKKITDKTVENLIISICNLFHCVFKINFVNSYPKEKLSNVMDYIYGSSVIKNKICNKKHVNNMIDTYKNFKAEMNKAHKNKFEQNKQFIYIFGLVFYYFQMVFVESLYQELLEWSDVRIIVNKYVCLNKYFKKTNPFDFEHLLLDTIKFTNNFVTNDDKPFSLVRRFILKIDI